jgi:hypothetical protein
MFAILMEDEGSVINLSDRHLAPNYHAQTKEYQSLSCTPNTMSMYKIYCCDHRDDLEPNADMQMDQG